MRFQMSVSIAEDVLLAFNAKAAQVGVTCSALAELFLRGGLATVPQARLEAWAASQRDAKQARKVWTRPLKQSEAKALGALREDWADWPILWSRNLGQSEKIFWRALMGLRARGLAEMTSPNDFAHRTGAIKSSKWRLAPAAAEASVSAAGVPG